MTKYVCPVCGNRNRSEDRFPICDFCGCEDVIILTDDEISEIQDDIRKLPEKAQQKYLTEEPKSDFYKMGIMTTEYIRQKYVFNDPRFSKSKFNERERKEEKDYQEFKEQSKRDVSALSKGVSVGLFGIFSQKVKHQFRCKTCGYEW